MKSTHPKITLFGSNSGNNVGDAAILSAILESITKRLPDAEFFVPTTFPNFVNEQYGNKYRVKALNIMPWNFSFRLFGLPSLSCLWKSDVALICDGIIFGKKLYNPAFNLLVTLAPLAFFARLFRCKLVCYSVGIGPFPNGLGEGFARYLIESCDLNMMRETDSQKLAQKIGVRKPIEITGDAAYINPVTSKEAAQALLAKKGIDTSKPLLGINITKYISAWLGADGQLNDTDGFVETVAKGVAQARQGLHQDFQPIIFSTHPMDLEVSESLARKLQAVVISNSEFLSHDMQGMMSFCSLFIGMRFHSLVLSSAVGVPIIGLVYAPKVAGLMKCLHSEEYSLALKTLTPEFLAERISSAWQEKIDLGEKQQRVVTEFKQGAERAADLLVQNFFSAGKPLQNSDNTEPLRRLAVGEASHE